MRKLLFFLSIILSSAHLFAQEKPKLVVGIVVDQMRMDYIYRYWDKYSEEGFKKLIADGYLCKNAHFNYIPTYTGPGHASVYTGTTPMNHGIIANNWFNKQTGEFDYCVSDDSQTTVGSSTEAGKMSPHRLLAPSLGDAVRTATLFRGKSFGISIKDRGAILPAGHSANAAYWFDYETGKMVSSSYYMAKLPSYAEKFNKQKYADKLIKKGWQTMLSADKYQESTADNTPYEVLAFNTETPTFPYDVSKVIKEKGYYAFAATPYGNTILTKFAEELVINEDLGADDEMDMLAISYSSPDIIGHAFGPHSVEVEDTYLRLDLEIATLLEMLNTRVGLGNYTLFLTADHAAAQVPAFLRDNGIPVNTISGKKYSDGLKDKLNEEFGEGEWIRSYTNQQIFLNHELIDEEELSLDEFFEVIEHYSLAYEGVSGVLTRSALRQPLPEDNFSQLAKNGWHQQRSGDVCIQYLPGWIDGKEQGTTHGSSYNYDTHVPIILYGNGIIHGTTNEEVNVTQIVPTICLATSIAFPDVSQKSPILGALKN